jgi:hypothetical protein
MDSKVVNRGIKATIWPILKDNGFSHFTSRSAWRFHADRIDIVNFQSFNSYRASVIGCTTYSFVVNLGCYLLYIPYQYGSTLIQQKGGRLLPEESQCPLRGRIHPKDRRQFIERLLNHKSPGDIWPIDEDGNNLASTLEEVCQNLLTEGQEWFKRFDAPSEVLRIFTSEPEQIGGLWGFGNNPSPHRSYCIGYTALGLGQYELALSHLNAARESGCFKSVESQLLTAVQSTAQPVIPPDAAR